MFGNSDVAQRNRIVKKHDKMYIFKLIYVIIFVLNLHKIRCQISDKRLCVDEKCSEPVSLAKTLLNFNSIDPRILSFKTNQDVTIYSKEAGNNVELWGAEIEGKRGYVHKKFIREQKILNKPTILVDIEPDVAVPIVPSPDNNVSPSKVKENYQVIDGTTIYDEPQDISPSSTITTPLASSTVESSNLPEPSKENSSEQDNVKTYVDDSLSNSNKDDSTSNEESIEIDDEDEDTDDEFEDDEDNEEAVDDAAEETEHSASNETKQKSVQNVEVDENLLKNTNNPADDTLGNTETVASEEKDNSNGLKSTNNLASGTLKDTENVVVEEKLNVDNSKNDYVPNLSPYNLEIDPQMNILKENQNNVKSNEAVNVNTTNTVPHATQNKQEKLDIVKEENLQKDSPQPAPVPPPSVEIESMINNLEKEEIPSVTTAPPVAEDIAPPLPIQHMESVTPNPHQSATPLLPEDENKIHQQIASEDVISNNNNDKIQDDAKPDLTAEPVSDVKEPENIPTAETLSKPEESIENPRDVGGESIVAPSGGLFGFFQSSSEAEGDSDVKQEAELSSNENDKEAASEYIENNKIEGSEKITDEKPNSIEQADPDNSENNDAGTNITEEPVNNYDSDNDKQNTPPSDVIVEDVNSNIELEESDGLLSRLFSFFSKNDEDVVPESEETSQDQIEEIAATHNIWSEDNAKLVEETCNSNSDRQYQQPFTFNSDIFVYLITTAASCIVFLSIYMLMDRSRREGPLVAKINKLEKEMLVVMKENELLQEQRPQEVQEDTIPSTLVEDLRSQLVHLTELNNHLEQQVELLNAELDAKRGLEEQIENLEKELETSTEVGMELNRIISEMLDPTNGSERLKENVEQLQRQLLEQKETISTTQELLNAKEMEIEALQIDLADSRKKANGLQTQLDELLEKLINIEKEKEDQNLSLQKELVVYRERYDEAVMKTETLDKDLQSLRMELAEAQHQAELKIKEYQILKDNVSRMKSLPDGQTLDSLLDVSSLRAQLEQLKSENDQYSMQLNQERQIKCDIEKKYHVIGEEIVHLKKRYEDTDKERMEAAMKLEVLNNYFKKRESELQEEVLKYKSIFEAKEGAATSTSERIKLMLEEIENYKSQNETLKQEILSQEIDLKSQISVLEKKVHENWVNARQSERKLEDARQEAAQLRNRLTLRERAFIEDRSQNRLQSPIDQNGDLTLSPLPSLDSPASPPPPIYGSATGNNIRDHITKSPPPLTGLPPPPFLPPPPGAPFMPPPLPGMPPFMPPPPSVFPGDHRPPPLGRMSSPPPPLNSRYSPDVSAFSPYDRNSPSLYDDSTTDYGTTPPIRRGYSTFNGRDDRREYKRQSHRNHRNMKGATMSSASDHSDNSMDKNGRNKSNMV